MIGSFEFFAMKVDYKTNEITDLLPTIGYAIAGVVAVVMVVVAVFCFVRRCKTSTDGNYYLHHIHGLTNLDCAIWLAIDAKSYQTY